MPSHSYMMWATYAFSPLTNVLAHLPRFVNSFRQGAFFYNAIFLPDPTEGFSWLTSGGSTIDEGTEILVDYGDKY